ncbi:MAG: ribonuclease R [Desulfobacterales bacterium]|nr:ribonuclease R [Desulfobacterales bacterium]
MTHRYKHSNKDHRSKSGRGRPGGLAEEVLAFLQQRNQPLSLSEIQTGLGLGAGHRSRKNLLAALAGLCRRQLVECPANKKYRLTARTGLHEGTLEMTPRGFGFVVLDTGDAGEPSGNGKGDRKKDPFVGPGSLGSAHHGDRVLVELQGRQRGRAEAKVVRVINRAVTRLVGIYVAGRPTGMVVPEEERLLFNILIRKEYSCNARNGHAVVAEIIDFKPGQRNPEGRIVEVLGDPENIAVQTEIVIRKHGLPHAFSEAALAETAALDATVATDENRRDLRDIAHVTIDGESARDFDDAVAIQKTKQGYRLHVSIADVSHYVRPGTVLDDEAYLRGTSVYFPNRVVPMLPERLSNDLCSLVPDQDRMAFTAVLDFDRHGRRKKKKFCRSVIRSRQRLTYAIVKKILVDQDPKLCRQHDGLLGPLQDMGELAALLNKQRLARGSIGFELPEAEITITADGEIKSVARAQRNVAHKLIEEFMLAANEAVAEALAEARQPCLYRIHETPDPVKVLEFSQFARSLGLNLPKDTGTPHWFGTVLKTVAGTPKEYIVNNLLLRTMQRARYAPENVGHFGLAAEFYTHFTSPIRRYPDLMVHRALTGLLIRKKNTKAAKEALPGRDHDLVAAGEFLSGRERVAVDAEREMTGRLQVRFMADKIGELFEGVISGVSDFGIYVELLGLFIHGAVAMAKLKGDYFQFDQKNYRLIGANTGRIFQMGDVVQVRVTSVDPGKRHINFQIHDPSLDRD